MAICTACSGGRPGARGPTQCTGQSRGRRRLDMGSRAMLPPHALALIAAAGASVAPPPCPAGTTPQPQPCSGHAGRFYCPSNRTAGQCDVPGNRPASCPKCDNAAPSQRFPHCHCPCAGCPTAAPYGTFAPPFPTTWSLVNSTVIGNAGNQNGWLSANASKYAILTIDWANNKHCWLTQNASQSQNAECMVEQARRIKASGTTKVYVYRNTQQALAIESSSRAVMYDPQYAGFFIRCADGSIYHRATNANGACSHHHSRRHTHRLLQPPQSPLPLVRA
eukprot:SAG22_NODE_405_length_11004_cov_4.629986_3_plen_278_part_00